MKRRELVKKIGQAAKAAGKSWVLVRDTGRHEIWDCDGMPIPIPRHAEINPWTAEGIMRDLEEKLGEDWWR